MNLLTKKKLTGIVAAFMLAVATLLTPVVTSSDAVAVVDCTTTMNGGEENCAQAGIEKSQGTGAPTQLFGTNSIFTTIVNVLLFIIGAVSVIMLIWGGIRYTTSAGNSASVTSAKNTIMYAIIGLIIAFLAFAIVNWVLGSLSTTA